MKKLNVNLSSIVIGFLLGVCLMLLVGATNYGTPRYQMEAAGDGNGGVTCWAIDTQDGMVWTHSGSWQQGESLPDKIRK